MKSISFEEGPQERPNENVTAIKVTSFIWFARKKTNNYSVQKNKM